MKVYRTVVPRQPHNANCDTAVATNCKIRRSEVTALQILLLFPKRIELIHQVAECHADDGDNNIGERCPDAQYFHEKLQTKIVDEDIAYGDEEISDHLCPAFQRGAREADVTRHPETSEEGDGKLENEGCNMAFEGNETQVTYLGLENEMVKQVIQHPLQNKIQTATSCIAEQFETYHLTERRIEEVDDRGEGVLYP